MPGALVVNLNGILPVKNLAALQEEDKQAASERSNQPVVQSLAAHVRECWSAAKTAKLQTVEGRMLANLRQRRGEYDADTLAEIRKQGMSEVFMMLTSNKCRAASAWLRDTLLGARDEKCWTIDPTPMPSLPETIKQTVVAEATQTAMLWYNTGLPMTREMMTELTLTIRDRVVAEAREKAKDIADRMELKMEDQLVEGGFQRAFTAFIDDLVTFPSAIIKGPVVRRKQRLAWAEGGPGGYSPVVTDELVPEWERVDPFMAYPAPNSTNIDDGYFIERHRMSRTALSELIGVDGYDDGAIRAVLDEYGRGGLHEWLFVDTAKAQAEGRSLSAIQASPDSTIDAIQFWGSVQGKWLLEWGMDPAQVDDPAKEYHCEVWLIGQWVIKATLNYDPMHRKPYFKTSYEEIPGAFWGNSPPDLIRDCQVMCNAAARALGNNMGIASGPQVVYNVDRMPGGEDLTQLYPWKIWQVTSDPYSGTAKPMEFFQPQSVAQELMGIYEKFSVLADEYSGIPRYMTGDNAGMGGAGRTASGMSMLMGNAGKTIKQVINNIDEHIVKPLIERLYDFNMRYGDDPDLKGDVNIVARGANSLVVKDAAQVRRNEFLQTALSSPVVQQVLGMTGIASLLREQAKTLDMDTDEIIPPIEVLRMREQAQAQAQAQLQQAQAAPSREQLMTGEPTTDNFSPRAA